MASFLSSLRDSIAVDFACDGSGRWAVAGVGPIYLELGLGSSLCCGWTNSSSIPFFFASSRRRSDLRHTFATLMAEEGIDLATLAKTLGHNPIRIVERYVHPTDEHKKSAMVRYESARPLQGSQSGLIEGKKTVS
jgi:hypothetical protein